MSVFQDRANGLLTDGAPSGERPTLVETSVPDASSSNVAPASCKHCGSIEPPDENGLCPTPGCRKFRVGNTAPLVHGARRKFTASMVDRRDAHAAALLAERGGRSALDAITAFNIIEYADLTVQYEDVTAYLMNAGTLTQAGRERAAMKHALDLAARRERVGALLQAAAPPKITTPIDYDGLTNDELIERAIAALRSLLNARDAARATDAAPEGSTTPDAPPLAPASITALPDVPSADADARSPEPECPYCRRRPCVGVDDRSYAVLHWSDPEEIRKRNERATRVMYESMRRARYGDPFFG
jgi:hypothetical protein